VEQSGSKQAIRNMKKYLEIRERNSQPVDEDKKGLLSRNIPKKENVNTGIESMADYILSIRKARLTDPQDSIGIINALEKGIPVETLTEVIQLGGVMEGLHTIDVGVLISPVIAETLIQLAEKAGIKYTVEDEEKAEEKMPEDLDIELATMDLEPKRKSIDEIMTGKEEPVDEIQKEEPKGLMARRVQDGV
jgi:hypothetical protein